MSRLLAWIRRVLGLPAAPAALPVRMDSPEEYWLDRARTAADRCRRVARQARQGAVAERCREVADQAAAGLTTMERLAGQASLLHRTLAGMNLSGLRAEEGRLRAALGIHPEAQLRSGLERSLGSIQEQERVAARLEQTQSGLLGRLEASAMELEGLNAGLAEVVALAGTGGDGEERLEKLGREVEGLRQGLVEAADVGRIGLEQLPGAPGPGSFADRPTPTVTGPARVLTATDAGSPIVPITDVDSQRTS